MACHSFLAWERFSSAWHVRWTFNLNFLKKFRSSLAGWVFREIFFFPIMPPHESLSCSWLVRRRRDNFSTFYFLSLFAHDSISAICCEVKVANTFSVVKNNESAIHPYTELELNLKFNKSWSRSYQQPVERYNNNIFHSKEISLHVSTRHDLATSHRSTPTRAHLKELSQVSQSNEICDKKFVAFSTLRRRYLSKPTWKFESSENE